MKSPRILILEFHQETNTFNPIPAGADSFTSAVPGEESLKARIATQYGGLVGACDVFAKANVTVIPTVFLSACSGGRVKDEVPAKLMEQVRSIAAEQEFDAIYACLHGATCNVSGDDTCGDLLEQLRALAGERLIAASFDLHANITEKILKNTDIICGYQEYPHVDTPNTGARAASLLLQQLEGKQLLTATAAIPMLIPPSGYTTMNGCFKALKDHAKQMVAEGKITDYSIFPVQPWLDIPEITSRVITIGEDAELAIECANILAQELFDLREEAETNLTSVDEIITIAEENKSGKPVLLAEASDSPGGGCPGDSPVVALKIQERDSTIRACMTVIDPAAVEKAFELGVGGTGEFAVGACYTQDMPGPFRAEGTVHSLHDGWFRTSKFGYNYIGRAAVVRFGNIDILLHCRGGASGQPQLMRQFGMEPLHYDLVVIKANTSFRASYQNISDLIYVADTPGAGAANLKRFRWQHLPKGLYPFETPQGPTPAKLK